MRSHEDAADTLYAILKQLDGNDVSLTQKPFIMGPTLTYDRKTERFTGPDADQANKFIRCSHREPFVLRDEV
jgi:hypothetical protein